MCELELFSRRVPAVYLLVVCGIAVSVVHLAESHRDRFRRPEETVSKTVRFIPPSDKPLPFHRACAVIGMQEAARHNKSIRPAEPHNKTTVCPQSCRGDQTKPEGIEEQTLELLLTAGRQTPSDSDKCVQ